MIQALDVSVLPRAARVDVEGLDVALGQPPLKDSGDKLASVVAAAVGGQAPFFGQSFSDVEGFWGGYLGGHRGGEASTVLFVEDRQDAQLPAVVGPVRNKVPAPDVVESLGPGGDSDFIADR